MLLISLLFSNAWANGNAVTFDGNDNNNPDQVVLGTLNPGSGFTVETWVEFDSISNWNTVVEAVNPLSSRNAFYFGYVQGQWQIEANDNTVWEGDSCGDGVALCSPYSLSTSTPYHLAIRVDGADVTLFVNGAEEASDTLTAPAFGSIAVWGMGADSDNGSAFTSDRMDGTQDELRVWSKALSQAEIQCTQNYALTGSEPDLYAYYPLDESSGSPTTADATGNGHDGTLYGDADFIASPFGLTPSNGGDIGCLDFDEDGFTPDAGDCDDTDPDVYPGSTEVCDGIDNDCDGTIDEPDATDALTWFEDADADGYGNAASTTPACTAPSGYVSDDTDCDDTTNNANPGATEFCDGIDNDCDGTTDEDDSADALVWNIDHDGDGYGNSAYTTEACSQPSGYVSDDSDCQDLDASAFPGATETCDGVDNDCDGTIDGGSAVDASTYYADNDGDGFGDSSTTTTDCEASSGWVENAEDCDDTQATTNPDADEVCDGGDNDCDGTVDENTAVDTSTWYADADGDGYGNTNYTTEACNQPSGWVADNTDCDDGSAAAYPGGTEVCDTRDNDCDGTIDEPDATDASTWYADNDGDGFGNASDSQVACDAPSATVDDATDCDDSDAAVNPDALEIYYDGVDSNCDGASDYDADEDGYDSADYNGDDCDDTDEDINPDQTEIYYDGIDSDCDGLSDYDADGDGYDSASFGGDDCDDGNADTYPGAPDTPHDGVINDCDLSSDHDADGDGYDSSAYGGDDCDDNNSTTHPGAEDPFYDGIDSNCDGLDDFDQDGDGYPIDTDCDDEDPTAFPGAPGWSDDCEEIGDTGGDTSEPGDTGDTGDTGSVDTDGTSVDSGLFDTGIGSSGIKGGGGCSCSQQEGQGPGLWWLVALLVPISRRHRKERHPPCQK